MPIEQVTLDNTLMTHTGKFQPIVNLQQKIYKETLYDLRIQYHPEILTATEEHPFYVREKKRSWNNSLTTAASLRKYEYEFGEPEWKNASKLTLNDHFGMVINSKEELPTFTFDKQINQTRTDKLSITLDKLLTNKLII